MNKDLISVIVPVYNVEKYINRCIDSIVSQTYENLEIIIVDDGSQDASHDICDSFDDKRITVIHKENGGLGFARNSGLEIARGKYVTFVDGDDAIAKNHIENMYLKMVENGADTCLCGFTKVYRTGQKVEPNVLADQIFENEDIMSVLFPRMLGNDLGKADKMEMSVCMKMFSNSIIQDNILRFHSEREYISEDIIFDYDYFPYSRKVVVIDDAGYFYYDNQASLTTKYNPNRYDLQKKLTLEEIRRSQELGIYDCCINRIYDTFLGIVRYSIKLEQKFAAQNGIANAKNNIGRICEDSMVDEVIKNTFSRPIPLKSKAVLFLIRHKMINCLCIVMKLKNHFNV